VENEIALSLSEKDAAHVDAFRSFMGSNHAIVRVHRHEYDGYVSRAAARFAFKSARVCEDLARLGVCPRKTFNAACSPELEDNADFWRGVIDGDGTIDLPRRLPRTNGAVVRLVGSRELLSQFAAFVRSISPAWRGTVRPHKSIWCVVVTGMATLPVLASLYGTEAIALPRKRDRAVNILRAGTRPSGDSSSRESRIAA
jgi:hypothetical protein